jgi:two-component system aerobic respiration control sensor histidine kinase ArcB
MKHTPSSFWVIALNRLVARFGSLKAGVILFLLVQLISLGCFFTYYYVALGHIPWLDLIGMMLFVVVLAPVFISSLLDINQQLNASNNYIESATQQENLLNQSLKENIRRLNNEIDDRKLAFQAKRRAIEELRREIAERKRTQQELDAQEVLLRSIVDSSPDLFYYRDNSGLFAGCNRMFEQVTGFHSNELIGKNAEDIFGENSLPSVLKTDSDVQKNHVSITLDVSCLVADELRWFEMRKVPFFNANREYIGLLGFGRDITSRKQAEQDLETAYKDKGKFIATLSHELRTPLNGIVGLTRMLLDTELSQEQRSWSNTVFSSAETLGNIFNDIIDLDKVDREQLDIACESINLADFLNDIFNFGGLIAQQKELEFKVSQSGVFDIHVEIDPTRLRQVLWNLINNAVKFTSHGKVTLSCKREYRGSSSYLSINITDTGIGIPENELSRIFDLYYKVPDISGGNALGSGIGLAVSRALILAMDGDINVASEVGKGSTFNIDIPLVLTEQPLQQVYDGRPLNILLVEDVPLNAEIATNLLEQRGHDVIWAETGEDALSFIETEDDLDIVLLDMQLPDINGDQIARIVRSRKEFDGLPLVALTANVRRAEEDLAGVKMQGSLAKPINTRKLDNVLARLFPHSTKSITEQASSSLPTNFAMADVDQAILDSETITDFFESMGVAPFARGVQLFEKLWPTYIAELNSALDGKIFSEYKSVAHKLKGAAGSVALRAVQQRAKYMEDNAESADLEQLSRWLDELPSEIEKGLKALNLVIENNH